MNEKFESLESDDEERKMLKVIRFEMIVDKDTLARFIPSSYLIELYRNIDEADEVEMRFKINSGGVSILP
jgi:hypothetical protein